MALSFLQEPPHDQRLIPAYSDTIFVVTGGNITGTFRHKYVCQVLLNHIEGQTDAYTNSSLVATLKVPANADGNGVFNLNKIIQDSVATGVKGIASTTKPNFTSYTSKFNGQDYDDAPHSIHQVDTYCGHRKLIRRWF